MEWQVIGSVGEIRIAWPEAFTKVSKAFKAIKVSFDVPSVACAISQTVAYTYYTRLLGYTLFPPALIAIMGLPTLWAILMRKQPELKDRLLSMFIRRALNVLFLVHPMVSEVVLSGLVCTDLGYDGSYLKYDVRVDCNSAEYAPYRTFALCMVAVWVLGYPLLLLGLLLYYKVPNIAARKKQRAKLGAFLAHSFRLACKPPDEGSTDSPPVAPSGIWLALLSRILHSLDDLTLPELSFLALLHGLEGASTMLKEELVRGLTKVMQKLIDSQEFAVSLVRWDADSPDPDERCACGHIGQIFMAYKPKRWWYAGASP